MRRSTVGFGCIVLAGLGGCGDIARPQGAASFGQLGGSTSSGSGGTSGGISTRPVTCQINASPDPCAALGLTCTGSLGSSASGTCQLPPEFAACRPGVGCAANLACERIPAGENEAFQCLHPCTHSADCPDLVDACFDSLVIDSSGHFGTVGLCYANPCGPGSSQGGGSPNGSALFGACNAGDGTGTCLPFHVDDGSVVGLCLAGGDVPLGGACELQRNALGASSLCDPGEDCLLQLESGNTNDLAGGTCVALCGMDADEEGSDGGPTCPWPSVCSVIAEAEDFGICQPVVSGPHQPKDVQRGFSEGGSGQSDFAGGWWPGNGSSWMHLPPPTARRR